MTNEDALDWCKQHSVIAIHHEQQIILIVPSEQIDANATTQKFSLSIRDGYVIAMSERGDDFHEVVSAAREQWRKRNVIDSLADTVGQNARPARLRFEDQTGLFDGI